MRPSITAVLRGALLGVATAAVLDLRSDPDLWGHLRFGSDVLDTFTIPSRDAYSFTGDRTWINHEWLFEVAAALIYRVAGAAGLSLAACAVALASVAVARHALRAHGLSGWRLDAVTAGVFLLGIAPLLQTFRPQVLSAAAFLVLLACIRAFDAGRRGSVLVLPPLFLLWANAHGGWVLGGTVLAMWATTRFVAAPSDPARRALIAACAAAAALTLVNPGGVHLWTFLLETVRLERSDIREWHQVTTSAPLLAVWAVTTTALVAAAWRVPRGARAYLVLGAFTALCSFRVMRLLPFHAMTVSLLVAPWLLSPFRPRSGEERERSFGARDWIMAAAVWAAVVGGGTARNGRVGCLPPAGAFAIDGRAGDFLRGNRIDGRLLVYFDWGEYALWHFGPRLQVSIDGRRETVYSARTIERHLAFYRAEPGARAYLDELAPTLVWLPRKVAVSSVLGTWGWEPVFESPQSVIWARPGEGRAWHKAQLAEPRACFPGP